MIIYAVWYENYTSIENEKNSIRIIHYLISQGNRERHLQIIILFSTK